MTTTTAQETPVLQKTRELCQTLTEQPEFKQICERITNFMNDEAAKTQYQLVMEKGEMLQHKQQMGMPVNNDEILDFENQRDLLVNNPVAKGFLEAREEMHKVQQSVGEYVSKTFELGRLPSEEDLHSGGCGSGCGCSH